MPDLTAMLYTEEEENHVGLFKLNNEDDAFMLVDRLHQIALKHPEYNTLYLVMWMKVRLAKNFVGAFKQVIYSRGQWLSCGFSEEIKKGLLEFKNTVRRRLRVWIIGAIKSGRVVRQKQ